jgi:hypothetical protein
MGETNKRFAQKEADTAAANQTLRLYTNPNPGLRLYPNFFWMRLFPIKSDGFYTNPFAGSPPHPKSIFQIVFPYQMIPDPA